MLQCRTKKIAFPKVIENEIVSDRKNFTGIKRLDIFKIQKVFTLKKMRKICLNKSFHIHI